MRSGEIEQLLAASASTCAAVRWRDPAVVTTDWQYDLGDVCDRLSDDAIAGTMRRATLAAPPRVGKSEHVGVGLPARTYLRGTTMGVPVSVLYATSSESRAAEVSAKVRGMIERAYRLTGDPMLAPGPIWQTTHWLTQGGHSWTALGWSATTGGVDGQLLIMDDVIGSSQTYRSPSMLGQIRRVVQEDLLSRRATVAVQMETRRGIGDTTGWLTSEWPGVWESHVWRMWEPGRGYLWPERYGDAWRAANPHLTDTSSIWRSLYQQEPVPEGGMVVDPSWLLARYPEPIDQAIRGADRIVIGADLVATGKTSGDWAVFVAIACRGMYRDVIAVDRFQAPYPEQRRRLAALIVDLDPARVVIERAAGGDGLVADLHELLPAYRHRIEGKPATQDKVARLTPHLPTLAGMRLRFPLGGAPWLAPFVDEVAMFTGHASGVDDQVDALVWALVAAGSAGPSSAALAMARQGHPAYQWALEAPT